MLRNFEVFNFKSFTKNTMFSLVKEDDITILNENLVGNVLKGMLFVGPNASGKTNSISALYLLLEIIHTECDLSRYVNIFTKGRMSLNYTFDISGKEVYYCIEYNSKTKLVNEKLVVDNTVLIDANEQETIKIRQLVDSDSDNEIFNKFINYLEKSYVIDLYNSSQSTNANDFKNPKIIYDSETIDEINYFLQKHNFDFKLSQVEHQTEKEGLFFIKQGLDVLLPFDMESIGNKTLVYLLPIMNRVIKEGGMLLLDEFGSGMHNALEELLIKYFMKSASASQIFLVSHSTNLISQNILRPDQIISVDYEDNSSIIFKFSTENPRSSQNLEKMYLGGVFGGLPNFNQK